MRSTSLARTEATQKGLIYKYPHDDARTVVEQKYVDDIVLKKEYYQPKQVGREAALAELWLKLRQIIRKRS
jgi:putative ATPase